MAAALIAPCGFSMVAVVVGCDVGVPGADYLASTPPPETLSLTDAAEVLGDGPSQSIAIEGRIGAGGQPVFDTERTSFYVSENVVDPDAGEGHDPSTCPFCKRRLARAPKAVITIVDASSQALDHRADQFLGVQEGDLIAAKGEATFDADLNLIQLQTPQITVLP